MREASRPAAWFRRACRIVAIEVEHARELRREYRKSIELEIEGTLVLPLETFLRRLHAGEIVG